MCIYACVVIYCVGWKMSLELFIKFQIRTDFLFVLVITWLQSFLLQLAFVIFATHQNTNYKFTNLNSEKICLLMTSWILNSLKWGIFQNSRWKFRYLAELKFLMFHVRVICNTLDTYLFTEVSKRKYQKIFLNMKPPYCYWLTTQYTCCVATFTKHFSRLSVTFQLKVPVLCWAFNRSGMSSAGKICCAVCCAVIVLTVVVVGTLIGLAVSGYVWYVFFYFFPN